MSYYVLGFSVAVSDYSDKYIVYTLVTTRLVFQRVNYELDKGVALTNL